MEIKKLGKYKAIIEKLNNQITKIGAIKDLEEDITSLTPDAFYNKDALKPIAKAFFEARNVLLLSYTQSEVDTAENQLHSHIEELIDFYQGEPRE